MTNAPLISSVLLGQRVELQLRTKVETGVVVGFSRARGCLRLAEARGYDAALNVWRPSRPRHEWERTREEIVVLTVLDGLHQATESESADKPTVYVPPRALAGG